MPLRKLLLGLFAPRRACAAWATSVFFLLQAIPFFSPSPSLRISDSIFFVISPLPTPALAASRPPSRLSSVSLNPSAFQEPAPLSVPHPQQHVFPWRHDFVRHRLRPWDACPRPGLRVRTVCLLRRLPRPTVAFLLALPRPSPRLECIYVSPLASPYTPSR
jgi:hypothetical protein